MLIVENQKKMPLFICIARQKEMNAMMRSHGFEVVLQNEETAKKICLGRKK